MYKKVLSREVVMSLNGYTVVKSTEQVYFDNGKQCGAPSRWYDVCLGGDDGDIVVSYNKLNHAKKWIKEN